MAFSNVSLTDTYNLWRTRHNQLVTWANALDAANVINFVSNTAALTIAGSSLKLGTVYFSIVSTTDTSDTSTSNVASASLANTIYQYARGQSAIANTAAANAYAAANTAFAQGNNAYNFANTVLITAQGAFLAANTVSIAPAFSQANTALTTAQGAFAQANTGLTTAQGAFAKANTTASTSTNGIVEIATTAEWRTGTDPIRVLSVSETWNSAAEVSLTDAATISLDMATFINANVTLGGNRTLGNPTNVKPGQSGAIRIKQDGTGSRTLSYSSNWEFAGTAAPVLSTPASNTDILFYYAYSATSIYGSLQKGVF